MLDALMPFHCQPEMDADWKREILCGLYPRTELNINKKIRMITYVPFNWDTFKRQYLYMKVYDVGAILIGQKCQAMMASEPMVVCNVYVNIPADLAQWRHLSQDQMIKLKSNYVKRPCRSSLQTTFTGFLEIRKKKLFLYDLLGFRPMAVYCAFCHDHWDQLYEIKAFNYQFLFRTGIFHLISFHINNK